MKKFVLGLTVGSLLVLALGSSVAQQDTSPGDGGPPPLGLRGWSVEVGELGWRPISEDIAIRVYTDRYGVRRATIGVLDGDHWEPVAVDGQEALLPPAIPTR